MIKKSLLLISTISLLNAGSLQDWADQTFKQGKYTQSEAQIKATQEQELKEETNKPDYSKATSLQDSVDMMFNQGKYAKKKPTSSNQDTNSKEIIEESKNDYSKASSLQDAVDMMFDQGKYKK